MTQTRVDVIERVADATPILDFWSQHAPTPLQSPQWLLSWWQAFRSLDTQLCLLVVRSTNEQVLGLAPCYIRNHWSTGRTIRFLGSGRVCSDFQTLLSAPAQAIPVATAIGEWLLANQPDLNWSLLELEGVTEDDPAIEALAAPLRRGHCLQHVSQLEHTWRLELSQGWAGFLAGLSKTQRSQTRTLVNRFDKSDDLALRLVTDSSEVPAALSACIDLHQRRWQAAGQPGCFADPRFFQFIHDASQQLSVQQQISIALLEDGGMPIAAQLYLQDAAGSMYMYQSGRDPEREAGNIGRMLNALAIRAACESGCTFIDFLRGDEIYKPRLGAVATRCLRVRCVAPQLLPRLRHSLRTLSRSVKHQVDRARENWNRPPQAEQPAPTAECNVSKN